MSTIIRWRRDRRRLVARTYRKAAAQALTDGAGELLRKGNETVPIEEHVLEASGHVLAAEPGELVAAVGYGGEASAYAVYQHEHTELRHDPGRRAKWLELTFQEDGERVIAWVGQQIKAALP